MRRTVQHLATSAVAVAAGLAAFAGTAAAAPVPVGNTPCTGGVTLCLFDNAGFAGSYHKSRSTDYNCHNLGSTMNNSTTSISNPSTWAWAVYDNYDCSGSAMATIYARTANDNIGSANNDRISSYRRI